METYCQGLFFELSLILPNRMHPFRHTALSEILNRMVGTILPRTIWCYALFGIFKYYCSVRSTGQSDVETKYVVPTVRGQWRSLRSVMENFLQRWLNRQRVFLIPGNKSRWHIAGGQWSTKDTFCLDSYKWFWIWLGTHSAWIGEECDCREYENGHLCLPKRWWCVHEQMLVKHSLQ